MSRQESQPSTQSTESNHSSRDQRIAAMRVLAGAEMPPARVGRDSESAKRPSRQTRRISAMLAALTIIVLLAVVGAAWQGWFPWQRGKPVASDNLVSVNLASYNLYCPSAAVWSPDNQRIAVLAQLGACARADAGFPEPNVVAIFRTNGDLVRLLYPDSAVLGKTAPTSPLPTPIPGTQTPSTIAAYVQYPTLGWSPDGERLALTYFATAAHGQSLPSEQVKTDGGVTLLRVDGTDGDTLSARYWSGDDIWDLQTRKLLPRDTRSQPPTLAYRWTSEGKLAPVTDTSLSGPVGSPSGGDQFTIWQSGSVMLDRQTKALVFSASVVAWSPDGRYLAPYMGFGGELTPGATGITRTSDGSYQLPPRDNALITAASQLKSPDNPHATIMPVAWRSDGRLLAALEPNPLLDLITDQDDYGTIPNATEKVVIYDCATGANRLTLTTKPLVNGLQSAGGLSFSPVIRWSSPGKQVLLLDTYFDSLTIWDVALK